MMQSGIEVYIQTSSDRTYMQVKNLAVVVISPKAVQSYTVGLTEDKVGEVTSAFNFVTLSAPYLTGSYVQLTTTAGFNMATSTVQAPDTFLVAPTATLAKINMAVKLGYNLVKLFNLQNAVGNYDVG